MSQCVPWLLSLRVRVSAGVWRLARGWRGWMPGSAMYSLCGARCVAGTGVGRAVLCRGLCVQGMGRENDCPVLNWEGKMDDSELVKKASCLPTMCLTLEK